MGKAQQRNNWQGLKKEYPREYKLFYGMHYRCETHHVYLEKNIQVDPCFEWTTKGFETFLDCMRGPIPKDMVSPTVARERHDDNYRPGNVFWQEKSENSWEAAIRNGNTLDRETMKHRMRLLIKKHPNIVEDLVELTTKDIIEIWEVNKKYDIRSRLKSYARQSDHGFNFKIMEPKYRSGMLTFNINITRFFKDEVFGLMEKETFREHTKRMINKLINNQKGSSEIDPPMIDPK